MNFRKTPKDLTDMTLKEERSFLLDTLSVTETNDEKGGYHYDSRYFQGLLAF